MRTESSMSPRNNPTDRLAPARTAAGASTWARGARRRSSEGGFVLITLLFFTAALAYMLVRAMPRTAMQAQRVREETLIYRGEQYKRAVQLYFRKYKKYPAKMDDLEESDGIRFLRRRYKDPLTGEDEWRLIHMGSDGRFKDSLLFDQEKDEDDKNNPYARTTRRGATSDASSFAASNAFRGADLARAERQSAASDIPGQGPSAADYMAAGLQAPADGSADASADGAAQGQTQQNGNIPYPNFAGTLPSQIPSATGAGAPVNPNSPYGTAAGAIQAAQANLPANQQSSSRLRLNPRQRPTGQPNMIGGMPQAPAAANVPPVGFGSSAAGHSAADLIRNLLTTPRPGGLAGVRGVQGGSGQNQRPSFAEGIAGVASKVEQRGVKVYNERESYNEWEFVYDYRQDASMAGVMGGAGQAGNMNASQPGINSGGTLQIDPSQAAALPGMPGYAGAAGAQPGAAQPADAANPYQQGVPAVPGTSPYDPASGAYPQPAQAGATPAASGSKRNSRGRIPLPPLPGQSIYPTGNQPIPGQPGQNSPYGVLTQPGTTQDPNQTANPQDGTQQQP